LGCEITTLRRKESACNEMLHRASDWNGFFGTTKVTDSGSDIRVWNIRSLFMGWFFERSIKRIIAVKT
jgi:hypothetical protein